MADEGVDVTVPVVCGDDLFFHSGDVGNPDFGAIFGPVDDIGVELK